MSLRDYIIRTVDPKAYYDWATAEKNRWNGDRDIDIFCPFHPDDHPGGTASLSVNPVTGAFFCHSCGAKGRSIISFHSQREDTNTRDAAAAIYHQFIHPVVHHRVARKYHRRLMSTPTALKYLKRKRLLTEGTLRRFKIGFDGRRFTIPIYNEFGLLINIRCYDPLSRRHRVPKMVNYRQENEDRSFGSPPVLYPIKVLKNTDRLITICEGEWDCLILNQAGIPAVTSTSGASTWPAVYNRMFAGLQVITIYDNDEAGHEGEKKVLGNLHTIAKSISKVKIPKKHGKDVTDWAQARKKMRTKEGWQRAISNAHILSSPNEDIPSGEKEPSSISLSEASEAKWFNRPIRVTALVTGKDTAPYLLPKRVHITCSKPERCEGCSLTEGEGTFADFKIDSTDPRILRMVDIHEMNMRRIVLDLFGIRKQDCAARIKIVETFNLEQLILIPSLDNQTGQYVMRSSYLVGHGTQPNRGYEFEGITVPHPRDQHATHLFKSRRPVQDEIDTFELSDILKRELKQFRPRNLNLLAHLMSIADWESRNITKIRERPDMHIGVDLAFHSVGSFYFNGELVPKGMLDILILGDTRCGKGYVTERLVKYYGLGEVASGENCSFAGLIGGLQQIGKRWIVTWGIIPLNHGRLVVIDETSSLGEEEIGHMSRVRSEGVAEISKIVKEQTPANTRLIWLSNCRSGKPIMTYNAGVEAVRELMGSNEDISRFDFALTVASNEVPSEVINALSDDHEDSDIGRFPRHLCRSLVLWAWSRTPEQVQFTKKATRLIIDASIEFGNQFSPTIPLVQGENIRIKLAKISAAVAARVFSSDELGDTLIVRPEHVMFTCEYLRMLYTKPSMAYDVFSQTSTGVGRIGNLRTVRRMMENLGDEKDTCIRGLLELHRITSDNLADFTGDTVSAKSLISDLVKIHCLSRDEKGNWYIKNPQFTSWMRKHMEEKSNGHA